MREFYGMRTGVAGGTAGAASVTALCVGSLVQSASFRSHPAQGRVRQDRPGRGWCRCRGKKYVLRHARCSRNDLEPGVQVGRLGNHRAFRCEADLHSR